jgi:3-oxoacyl-[acyl-carrier protein] reductase
MNLGLAAATAAEVGGSSGMGLATARCLAEDGSRVAVIGRSKATLDNAVTDLTDRGSPDALGLVADIADTAQVEKVFAELSERWDGELNVLINTVGPGAPGLFEDLTDEQWRQSVEGVSKNLSLQLAKDEILVNVVSPGSIASESLVGWAKSVGVDGSDPYRLMDAIGKHFGHPAQMPRAGLPEEIGPVVAFLASRRNSYMTGANINVDGGSDFT